jgi:hypothetical protein
VARTEPLVATMTARLKKARPVTFDSSTSNIAADGRRPSRTQGDPIRTKKINSVIDIRFASARNWSNPGRSSSEPLYPSSMYSLTSS